MVASFAQAFIGTYAGRVEAHDHEALDHTLQALVSTASTAWPQLAIDARGFVTYIAERLPTDRPPLRALVELACIDLYLACACHAGDARAIALFDDHVLSEIPRFISRIDSSREVADSVAQTLRVQLFMDDRSIGQYTGRGSLRAWIRVAAIRTALNARRERDRAAGREDKAYCLEQTADPELELVRARYAKEVKVALEHTLRALSVDERNVLRMHYFDGLSTERIAEVYGVSRATAFRWVADARRSILRHTNRQLRQRLREPRDEIDRVIALVRSQLDVSLRRLLATG